MNIHICMAVLDLSSVCLGVEMKVLHGNLHLGNIYRTYKPIHCPFYIAHFTLYKTQFVIY